MPRLIAHVDMDAFDASVELLSRRDHHRDLCRATLRPAIRHGPDEGRAAVPTGDRAHALRIRDEIHAATGLTCSVGVAPNKLLAKLDAD